MIQPNQSCTIDAWDGYEASSNHRRLGGNDFELRIDSLESTSAEQEREDYCWAAAIQIVLAHYGVTRSQCAIVQELFGDCRRPQPYAASRSQIVTALNRWTVQDGAMRVVRATSLQSSADTILNDIARNYPLVVGLRDRDRGVGHVCVLYGVRYCYVAAGYGPSGVVGVPAIIRARLYDPWPGEGPRTLGQHAFREQLDFAVRIYVV